MFVRLWPPPSSTRDELYTLLDVDRRATAADIKRAYRNKSLQMHPDKLNQRGQEVTEQDRADFQKMKSAYDVSPQPPADNRNVVGAVVVMALSLLLSVVVLVLVVLVVLVLFLLAV